MKLTCQEIKYKFSGSLGFLFVTQLFLAGWESERSLGNLKVKKDYSLCQSKQIPKSVGHLLVAWPLIHEVKQACKKDIRSLGH